MWGRSAKSSPTLPVRAGAPAECVLMTGLAGAVAGALSMALGEYVSVKSQADTEQADLDTERRELAEDPHAELAELENIYVHRGLDRALARQVAEQLTAHDALAAHARDELGISHALAARPLQAALASAAAFSTGATLPIVSTLLAPAAHVDVVTTATTVVGLTVSGALAAYAGGAPILRGALRVAFWGALAMAASAGLGHLFQVRV